MTKICIVRFGKAGIPVSQAGTDPGSSTGSRGPAIAWRIDQTYDCYKLYSAHSSREIPFAHESASGIFGPAGYGAP